MSSELTWIDYIVFVVFLVVSVAIGIYHACTGGKQKSAQEFISGNRNLSSFPTMISLVLSYVSAISILGSTAEVYAYGTLAWIWTAPAFCISAFMAERVYIPWVYRMKLTSVFEYLAIRYKSRSVHFVGVMLGLICTVFFTGTAFYAPALALEAVSGFSVPTTLCIMAIVCTFYTALGGMKAVVYTDCFQGFVLLAGCLAIMIKGFMLAGGARESFDRANKEGRIIVTDFSFDPRERHTVWGMLVGLMWTQTMMFGVAQPSVQRYCSLPTLQKARQVTLMAAVPFIIISTINGLIGIAIYGYYSGVACDPVQLGILRSPNQLVPFFVVTVFSSSPGLAGLFMAAIFGGAMSTISSSLSACAAIAWKDLVQVYRPHTTDIQGAIVNKILVVIFALIMVGLAFVAAAAPSMPLLQTTLTFVNISAGPVAGLFLLGGLFRVANWKGALTGCIFGLIITVWLGFGSILAKMPHDALPMPGNDHCNPTTLMGPHGGSSSPHHGGGAGAAAEVNYTLLQSNYTSYRRHVTTAVYTEVVNASVANSNMTIDVVQQSAQGYQQPDVTGIKHLYRISYVWYALIGSIVTFVIGIFVSVITDTPADGEHLKDDMFITWSDVTGPVCMRGATDEPSLDVKTPDLGEQKEQLMKENGHHDNNNYVINGKTLADAKESFI